MAHENLRFNLLLRNSNNPSLSSKTSYNPVYTDQYYGTHFGVFADFKPKDPNATYTDEFEVGKIAMRLQNYTGAVTLGISSILSIEIMDTNKDFIVEGFSTGRTVELSVCLQAFEPTFQKNVDLDALQKNFTFKTGDLLSVKVYLKPIDNAISNINENEKSSSLYVDDFYMKRDGETITVREDKIEIKDAIRSMEASGFTIIQKNPDDKARKFKDFLKIRGGFGDRQCKLWNSDIFIV